MGRKEFKLILDESEEKRGEERGDWFVREDEKKKGGGASLGKAKESKEEVDFGRKIEKTRTGKEEEEPAGLKRRKRRRRRRRRSRAGGGN